MFIIVRINVRRLCFECWLCRMMIASEWIEISGIISRVMEKPTKKNTSSIKMMLTMRIVDPAVLESDTVYESDRKSRSMFP